MLLETKCKSGTIKKGKERKKTRTSGAVLESVPNVIAPFLFVSGLISLFFYLFFFNTIQGQHVTGLTQIRNSSVSNDARALLRWDGLQLFFFLFSF
jgi:hypothetical protein